MPDLFVHTLLNYSLTSNQSINSQLKTNNRNEDSNKPNPNHQISNLNLFGLNFFDLLVRHRRSMIGENFYQVPTTTELMDSYKSYSNMLELVIDICLQFMCSCLPVQSNLVDQHPTMATMMSMLMISRQEFSEAEFGANYFVQNMAVQVLELIVQVGFELFFSI